MCCANVTMDPDVMRRSYAAECPYRFVSPALLV